MRPGAIAGAAGLFALAMVLAAWLLGQDMLRSPLRERGLDLLLRHLPARDAPQSGGMEVAIVDIDRESLARLGPWPWPRPLLARLVAAVAAAQPTALGLDMLLAEPARLTPAALAQVLGDSGRSDLALLAAALPDPDAGLAEALAAAPAVLGFALEPDRAGPDLAPTPVLLRGAVGLPDIWRARGVIGPAPELAAVAQGTGALALAADADGVIRRVPLLVYAGGGLRPGFAVDVLRLAQEAGALIIGPGAVLTIGAVVVPLDADASLRLTRSPGGARTISAATLLDDPAAVRLAGHIVLIGGSAPELGGLRGTSAANLTPSVQIQAEAVVAMLSGRVAHRPPVLATGEAIGALLLGLLGLVLVGRLRPLAAAGLMLAGGMVWVSGAAAAVAEWGLLVDPAGPPVVAFCGFAVAGLARFASDEFQARRLRASFEQHLAPEVVRRIVADPGALRLQGEMREITAFFTDIEGFTAMTERADPVDLVALLDAYFDSASRIVTEHGGMIEKIVGDAVHAIFNAPFGLDQHPRRAFDCALALLAATEAVRRSALGERLQLGRTRIGIETGQAIVGDVGGSRKLDYTAHGNAMNTAARLEAANKELGSSICIGPGTAARLDPACLRQIGVLTLRGQSQPIAVFTPAVLP